MSSFTVTRRLEIDAAHRIPDHGSRCRHLHGHRYVVEAACGNPDLHESGEERGMVLDFGFLKEEMLAVIDGPCDHGLLLSVDDQTLLEMLAGGSEQPAEWLAGLRQAVAANGFAEACDPSLGGKLYLLPGPPTAEVLARHWFQRLAPRVQQRSQGHADLLEVTVWETPNCWARYRP
ncbi:6-pyruvoyltetrahydropterin/6-carboxytetrahydropterin synthase [Alkalispirillum mobile]|uniref:6-carboxy-5,6,7,8-tetrahydropterin synthase n=1 Tax=Alkalispirillum mobile TaxID=85925 RepID=A0A498BYX9_9GAMM|nr:6-carboxytetrahydropterin synthase [Alkalispirillum mobile]RLK48612.1 6-pyruvoyltetrahydropterin/6-carboxytetrahydropterin synthase [Alkalispirillum mobile]